MPDVVAIKVGPLSASICASEDLTGEEAAVIFERQHQCGTELGWILDEAPTFKDGTPNGCQCEQGAGRRHWLLTC